MRFFFSPPALFMASKTMPRGKGAVADHGHDVPRFSSGCSRSSPHLQAQGRGHAAAGVAGHEQVVVAFGRIGVAHQAALGPHRVELVVAAGDHLVGVDLVAGVPDQAVAAEIEGGVQGQGQLDHAQVRGEMGRPRAGQPAERLAHLGGQLRKLLVRKLFQIVRAS